MIYHDNRKALPQGDGQHGQAGFTLTEMLVTMAILAIFLAVAVPALQPAILNARMGGQVQHLIASMNYARSYALSQRTVTTVCPYAAGAATPSGVTSASPLACGTSWAAGWMVGPGVLNASGASPVESVTKVLQVFPLNSMASGLSLSADASTNIVAFSAQGTSTHSSSLGAMLATSEFTFCDPRGATSAATVEVTTTGYVQANNMDGTAVWGGAPSC